MSWGGPAGAAGGGPPPPHPAAPARRRLAAPALAALALALALGLGLGLGPAARRAGAYHPAHLAPHRRAAHRPHEVVAVGVRHQAPPPATRLSRPGRRFVNTLIVMPGMTSPEPRPISLLTRAANSRAGTTVFLPWKLDWSWRIASASTAGSLRALATMRLTAKVRLPLGRPPGLPVSPGFHRPRLFGLFSTLIAFTLPRRRRTGHGRLDGHQEGPVPEPAFGHRLRERRRALGRHDQDQLGLTVRVQAKARPDGRQGRLDVDLPGRRGGRAHAARHTVIPSSSASRWAVLRVEPGPPAAEVLACQGTGHGVGRAVVDADCVRLSATLRLAPELPPPAVLVCAEPGIAAGPADAAPRQPGLTAALGAPLGALAPRLARGLSQGGLGGVQVVVERVSRDPEHLRHGVHRPAVGLGDQDEELPERQQVEGVARGLLGADEVLREALDVHGRSPSSRSSIVNTCSGIRPGLV